MTDHLQLRVESLCKAYGPERRALDNLDLTLGPGIYGLLGPNGAGKTSLLRILAADLDFDSGRILLSARLNILKPQQWRRQMGFLPQHFDFPPNTTGREMLVEAALLLGLPPSFHRPRIDELLEHANLVWAADRYAAQYSRGMKQRLGFALSILHQPQLLLLDEPTAGLDPIERNLFRELLALYGQEHIVILSTHLVGDIERSCHRIGVLAAGTLLFDGPPRELTARVAGRVTEHDVEEHEAELLVAERRVISARRKPDGHMTVRTLEAQPNGPAGRVSATLEDAYFDLLGGQI